MMDFKFDIRILIVSLLLHFGAYALLSFYTADSSTSQKRPLEFTILETKNKPDYIDNRKTPKPPPEEKDSETDSSYFASDRKAQYQKESIVKKWGTENKNSAAQGATQKGEKVNESITAEKTNIFLPSNNIANETVDESTVNFRAPHIANGEMTFLNSDFSSFALFFKRIRPNITFNWARNIDDIAFFPHLKQRLLNRDQWSTIIECQLDSKGNYVSGFVSKSSGMIELDHAVLDSIKQASPFVNPPSGMIKKNGLVPLKLQFVLYTRPPAAPPIHFAKPFENQKKAL